MSYNKVIQVAVYVGLLYCTLWGTEVRDFDRSADSLADLALLRLKYQGQASTGGQARTYALCYQRSCQRQGARVLGVPDRSESGRVRLL